MTEPRYRIRAVCNGRLDSWIAFDRQAIVLVRHPSQAYVASRESIDAFLRRRGSVFGHCDLTAEEASQPEPKVRAFIRALKAGRTRKLYLACAARNDKCLTSIYPHEAFAADRNTVAPLAREYFGASADVEFEEVA